MKVIKALRYCQTEWVCFIDLDKTGNAAFSHKMKKKNIKWDFLRGIEWKNVSTMSYGCDGCLYIRYHKRKAVYEE